MQPNVITCNCGIAAYMRAGNFDRGFAVLDAMRERWGLQPQADTCNTVLTALLQVCLWRGVGFSMGIIYVA
ncbi:unnamed protein product, partial [Phaeothamnion confervicola]